MFPVCRLSNSRFYASYLATYKRQRWYAVCTQQTGFVAMQHAVAYYRVSTARQGRSGLGIDAQRAAVHRFAQAEGFELIAEFVEVETGKCSDALDRRPQLSTALAAGRAGKCPVIV